ncbi:O-antigen ligase family protein [Candidatus Uabimicrobium amorphum]|uniref:O-antigen ligase-related domain-containing protein n=1 Tax=Uabimicrobium amorphum TaxID=2596890 RepID=A0A5S9ISX6_UABAM|nr:O-antigen ligase family protein [Candidatus Uabimicrobium amorphum]BBM86055.1 hypothetical protein UABAM_04441 [Candidatus Uabimicrobium amorphum]
MSHEVKTIIKMNLCLQIIVATLGYGGNIAYVWGPLCVLSLVNLILVFDQANEQNPYISALNVTILLFFVTLCVQFFVPSRIINVPSHPELQVPYFFSSQNVKLSIYQWLLPISAMITIPQVLKTEEDFLWLLRCLIFVVLLQVIVGVVQYFLSRESLLYQYFPFFSRKRGITGTYVTRNLYANILVVGTPLLLGQILHFHNQKKKLCVVLGILCCLLMFLCLLASKSRTGVFLYLLIVIGIFLYHRHIPTIALIFAIIVVLFAFQVDIMERFYRSGEDFRYRLEHYSVGLKIIRDHWLFGCGAGNFSLAFEMYRDVPVVIQYFHQDNDYIEFVAEYGILSSIAGVIFLLVWGILIAKNTSYDKMLWNSVLVSIIMFFVFAAFHFPLFINSNRLFLAYLMGTLVAMSNATKEVT